MEKFNMNTEKDLRDPIIEGMDQKLFIRWVNEEFLPNHVAEPINTHRLVEDFELSRKTGDFIDFLGVGCQQFSEVSDENGESVSIPTAMNLKDTHRFGRFFNEFMSMIKALESFGVRPRVAITFSDAETELTKIQHKEMLNDIDSVLETNVSEFSKKLQQEGVNVVVFSHVEVLKNLFMVSNFEELIGKFFENTERPTVEAFLDRLYNSDPINLPPFVPEILSQVNERNSVDTVWLDIMSPLAGEHRVRLHKAIQRSQPDMPVIVPFRNSGKWETAVEQERIFKNRFEFISNLLSISPKKKKDSWLRNALSCADDNLERFFNVLGVPFKIDGPEAKEKAVRLLEKFTFGTEEFSLIEEVNFNQGDTVKNIIVRNSGWAGSHVFGLIKGGNVKVNGLPISIEGIKEIKEGDTISVGSLNLRLKVNG